MIKDHAAPRRLATCAIGTLALMLGGCNLTGLSCHRSENQVSVTAAHNYVGLDEVRYAPYTILIEAGVIFGVAGEAGWVPSTGFYSGTENGIDFPAETLSPLNSLTEVESTFAGYDHLMSECDFSGTLSNPDQVFYYISPLKSDLISTDTGSFNFTIENVSDSTPDVTMVLAGYAVLLDDVANSGPALRIECIDTDDITNPPVEINPVMSTTCSIATALPLLGPVGLGITALLLSLIGGLSQPRKSRS